MTLQRLEWCTGRVRRQLVIARHYPHLAFVFDSDLCRPENVTGRMKRDLHSVNRRRLSVILRNDLCGLVEADPRKLFAVFGDQITTMSTICMVGMCVGDNGLFHRSPWIDVKIALLAVETPRGERD